MAQREARYSEAAVAVVTTGRSPEEVAREVERLAREAGLGVAAHA
jgi:pyruvate/2-oxoacid:ferredoxin oxidoreductase alpha subunit